MAGTSLSLINCSEDDVEAATVVASGTCGANLTWILDSDCVLTISGTGSMYDYEFYNGGEPPWSYLTIKSLVINESVTTIGNNAFCDLRSCTSFSLPSTLTSIGMNAFYCCLEMTSITIPNSVTTIGGCVFSGCHKLSDVTLSNSLTTLSGGLFSGCSGLTSITIPNSVTTIEDGAFSGCSKLTSITIPSSVTTIGNGITEGCSSLISINVDPLNTSFRSENGILYNDDITTLISYPAGKTDTSFSIPNSVTSIGGGAFISTKLTSVTIPDSVTTIGSNAFEKSALTSISIPNTVTTIGSNAFEECKALVSVTLPNAITSVSSYCFQKCSALTSISIPNSVTTISYGAFRECTSLASISLSASVTNIYDGAFQGCTSITSYTVDGENTAYSSEDGILYNKAKTTLISFPAKKVATSYAMPNTVTTIGSSAFLGCNSISSITLSNSLTSIGASVFKDCTSLASIMIPNSVTSIGGGAFSGCTSLTSITIPNTVSSIGSGTFSGCSSLVSVVIPDSVTTYGDEAFKGCTSLKNITISNNVTNIGERSFRDCSSLESFNVASGNANYSSDNGVLYNKAKTVLIQYPSKKADTSYIIPNSVTTINPYAFAKADLLKSVSIPNTITVIQYNTFDYCSSLESITIPSSVTKIEQGAFYGCSGLKSVTIPDSVTRIETLAFGFSKPDTIKMPGSFISYGEPYNFNPFSFNQYQDWHPTITFTKSLGSARTILSGSYVESIIIDPSITSISNEAFNGITSLKNVTMPGSYTSLGTDIFKGCNLDTITFTGSSLSPVNKIISNASVKNVIVNPSTTAVKERTFEGCNSVTVHFDETTSVTSIETLAFIDCKDLKIVVGENARLYFNNGAIYYSGADEHIVTLDAPEGFIIPETALSGNIKVVNANENPSEDEGPGGNNDIAIWIVLGAIVFIAIAAVVVYFTYLKK